MRYILDNEGYVEEVSFGANIMCNGRGCTEYTGAVPEGYDTLCDWSDNANIRAYKLVNGNLTLDVARQSKLEKQFVKDAEDHRLVCYKEIKNITSVYNEDVFEMYETSGAGMGEMLSANDTNKFAATRMSLTNTGSTAKTEEAKVHHITDSSDAYCKDVEIFGESIQATLESKDIFNKDNVIELKAYLTEGNVLAFSPDSKTYMIPCEINTKYTISHENISNTIFRVAYTNAVESDFPNSNGENIRVYGQIRGTTETSLVLTTGDNATFIAVQVTSAQASVTKESLEVINFAKPSPECPSEIKSVSESVTIKSTGDNGQESIATIPLLHDMRSLPNGVRDRIYYSNGKWYDEQRVGRVILNGSEEWSYSETNKRFSIRYAYAGMEFTESKRGYVEKMCSHFKYYPLNATGKTKVGLYENGTNENYSFLMFIYPEITTLEDWKAWLTANNIEIIYELETPIITEITDEATITALESIKTFKGITNITADAPNVLTYVTPIKDEIRIKFNSANMLPNEATSQTVSGISFTQNADKSILINGTATADIEYLIAGSETNTTPILQLKKNALYTLFSLGYNMAFYNYDGTDRTQVFSGTDQFTITDESKDVTQIVLEIPEGATFDNWLLQPQLVLDRVIEQSYVMHESNEVTINLGEYNFDIDDEIVAEQGTVKLIKGGASGDMIVGNYTEYELDSINMPLTYKNGTYMYAFGKVAMLIGYPSTKRKLEYENTSSRSGGFIVDEEGNVTLNNATVTGGNINLTSDSDEDPKFRVYNSEHSDYAYLTNKSLQIMNENQNFVAKLTKTENEDITTDLSYFQLYEDYSVTDEEGNVTPATNYIQGTIKHTSDGSEADSVSLALSSDIGTEIADIGMTASSGDVNITLSDVNLETGEANELVIRPDGISVNGTQLGGFGVGSVYITSTNTDPSATLGGTWELIDKEFAPAVIGDAFTINTTNTTSAAVGVSRAGHSINITSSFVNKVKFTDSTITVGTFDLEKLGISSQLDYAQRTTGWSDGANSVLYLYLTNVGVLESRDINYSLTSISAGESWQYSICLTIGNIDNMLNEACNKFYWKRIE